MNAIPFIFPANNIKKLRNQEVICNESMKQKEASEIEVTVNAPRKRSPKKHLLSFHFKKKNYEIPYNFKEEKWELQSYDPQPQTKGEKKNSSCEILTIVKKATLNYGISYIHSHVHERIYDPTPTHNIHMYTTIVSVHGKHKRSKK